MLLRLVLFALSLAALPAIAAEAGTAPAPLPAQASKCLSCHGANGRPALAEVPIIAGQQPAYLANALRAYRDGSRSGGQALVMQEMARGLADDDIAALAAWFGDQS